MVHEMLTMPTATVMAMASFGSHEPCPGNTQRLCWENPAVAPMTKRNCQARGLKYHASLSGDRPRRRGSVAAAGTAAAAAAPRETRPTKSYRSARCRGTEVDTAAKKP